MLTGDFYCETCQKKMKARAAGDHHRRGDIVWYLDPASGALSHRVGTKRPDAKPLAKTVKITAEGDEHIKEHAKGYEKDKHDVVFILNRETGKMTDIRHEHPLLMPIYELCQRDMGYKGTFPQFLADGIETLFAMAGYELILAPKQQGQVYDEVARLKREGKIAVFHTLEGIVLEVVHGNEVQSAQAGAGGHGGQIGLPGEEPQRGEEESGQSQ